MSQKDREREGGEGYALKKNWRQEHESSNALVFYLITKLPLSLLFAVVIHLYFVGKLKSSYDKLLYWFSNVVGFILTP